MRQNLPDKLRFQFSDEIVDSYLALIDSRVYMMIMEILTLVHIGSSCRLDELTFGGLAESKRDPKSPTEYAPTPMSEQTS